MKYKHTNETKIVLDDLENRVIQMIEANQQYTDKLDGQYNSMIDSQALALQAVLVLIKQVRNTGHVKRGTPVIPDDLEPIVKTKWNKRPQLGLSEQMELHNAK